MLDRPLSELPVYELVSCLPVCRCCGTMNIYLRKDDGAYLRFKMTPADARDLAQTIESSLALPPAKPGTTCPQCGIQSSKSSGRPQSAGSPHEGHQV